MSLWTPESPFLETPSFPQQNEGPTLVPGSGMETPWLSGETPFIRDEYETGTQRGVALEAIAEFLAGVHDESFEASIHNLAAKARDHLGDRFDGEYGAAEAQSMQAERELEHFFSPLQTEAENMLDRMAEGLSRQDFSSHGEAEIEALLAQYLPAGQLSDPEFEDFLGNVFKKAVGVVKGAVNLAKKGVSGLAKLGLNPLLMKLKALVMPLLQRVIKMALNKLPAGVRPIAQKVAQALFGKVAGEAEVSSGSFANATSAESIQQEFDLQLADMLLSTEFDSEQELLFMGELESSMLDPGAAMHAAKAKFTDEFSNLERGQNPLPVIQNFLPAALIALQPVIKTAISIIGRPRVVDFIAGLLAKLVERWVGPEAAKALATPAVDIGLGLLGFETGSINPRMMTAELIAETLESAILQTAQLPPAVFENEVMLEAEVREAFEKAAAAHFPDAAIRHELRETGQVTGAWVAMPSQQKRKYYRKYSRIFDIEITPQIASQVKIFGGATLGDFLQDVLLLSSGRPVKAKVHLYELTLSSRLVDISLREKNVPGLGAGNWKAWSQIHPLTPEAATALLKEPGLAKQVDAIYLAGPYLTGIGQRFYYLQIPGLIRPQKPKPPQATCTNRSNVTVNLGGARIVVRLQFSERTAQEIAQALRRGDIAGAWRIAKTLDNSIREQIRNRNIGFNIIGFELEAYTGVSEEVPALVAKGIGWLLEKIADKLFNLLWEAIANYFKSTAQEFIRAAEDPADGIVVYVAFVNLPGLTAIRNFRAGGVMNVLFPTLDQSIPRPSISIHAGCKK